MRIKVPDHLSRLLRIGDEEAPPEPGNPARFMPVESLIRENIDDLFPGMRVGEPYVFRVTRDADVEIREDEANDLLVHIEEEIHKRRFGDAVRLEIEPEMPDDMVDDLQRGLELDPAATYRVDHLLAPAQLGRLVDLDLPQYKFAPFAPRTREDESMFARIDAGDLLIHHPFDSFVPVAQFLREAARDPDVVAIKQTLYRTSGRSSVIGALLEAAENGKQVAAVVELKARFDEQNNIVWARRLERAGVHVIYGVPGLKTHAKLCIVVRREETRLRRYVHVGTGNYNPVTARIYTDLGLFSCDPALCADVSQLFNRITGYAQPPEYKKILVAPGFLFDSVRELIRFETSEARAGRPARIVFKCNALTEPALIADLYEASEAGVQIDLIVRGICSLVPGIEGTSSNIRVRSVVGRFLEHSRVYWFHHAGTAKVYMGSADLMGRNLHRRVEVSGAHRGRTNPGLAARRLLAPLPRRCGPGARDAVRRQLRAPTRSERHGEPRRAPPIPGRSGLTPRVDLAASARRSATPHNSQTHAPAPPTLRCAAHDFAIARRFADARIDLLALAPRSSVLRRPAAGSLDPRVGLGHALAGHRHRDGKHARPTRRSPYARDQRAHPRPTGDLERERARPQRDRLPGHQLCSRQP